MNCKIVGYEFKSLEVILAPGETFYGERKSIVYVDAAIQREVEFNATSNGVAGKLGGIVKSALSGESILILKFYNPTSTDKKIVLSGSCCSLFPIKLQGESLICRKGLYVASTNKLQLNVNLTFSGIIGGFFQKMTGEATVFLDSFGTPIEKHLSVGEVLDVDENHVVALHGFQSSQIQKSRSLGNSLQGEGLSLMRLQGPGKLYLTPIPIPVN